MSKLTKIIACLCASVSVLGLTACGGGNTEIKVTMSEDGYLIINDVKTDIKSGKDGQNGKSAYEIFVDNNSWYTGSEQQWIEDIASGNLASSKEYSIISYGKNCDADIVTGSVSSKNATLTFTNAVMALNDEVVLPVTENSSWEISFKSTVMPSGSGVGQLLTSFASGLDGRIYLGVYGGNQVMFLGVCIGTTYANYCWDVPLATLSTEHQYTIKFKDGMYLLTIDGGGEKTITSLSINHLYRTSVRGDVASKELTQKIKTVTGQEYITFTHLGADSHKLNLKIDYLNVKTSSIYGYQKLNAHPISEKTIYYLGSSITRGHGGNTDGTSFADLTARLTGNEYKKEAISGTNLAIASGRNNSYVERITNLDFTQNPDVLVVQLSTNDFSNNVPYGQISNSVNSADMDKTTITGAIEYIIAYAKERCPDIKVVVFTCPLNKAWGNYAKYETYANGTLRQIEEKWEGAVSILDVFNAEYIKVPAYMQSDNLHPQLECYAQVFVPEFIKLLENI